MSLLVIGSSELTVAGRPPTDPTIDKLMQPMRAIVDGKAFREAIESVAGQATINVWLDRKIDPSVTIAPGPVGPTCWSALNSIAATQDCVVFPVANVVLIGRPGWVDRTAESVLLSESESKTRADRSTVSMDVQWPDLTSPLEALQAAAGQTVTIEPPLPHDLWPGVQWRRIDRQVAIALVLAQFDRRRVSTGSAIRIRTKPADALDSVQTFYRLGGLGSAFRRELDSEGFRGRISLRDGEIMALGSITGQRLALAATLSSADASGPSNPQSVYTIKRMQASAEHAFQQLAKLADSECHISDNAREACQRILSIEGENLTIRQLIQLVAAEAGVTATWKDDTIVISQPSPITD